MESLSLSQNCQGTVKNDIVSDLNPTGKGKVRKLFACYYLSCISFFYINIHEYPKCMNLVFCRVRFLIGTSRFVLKENKKNNGTVVKSRATTIYFKKCTAFSLCCFMITEEKIFFHL